MSDLPSLWLLVITIVLIVVAGVVAVLLHRFRVMAKDPERASDMRMTRPVLAIILVGCLVLLTTWSMGFGETGNQVQLLLVGAVVSLGSAVVAYYFSSSGAADARRDLLAATMGTAQVPDLMGKQIAEARKQKSGHAGLGLAVDPTNAADLDLVIAQVPRGGQVVAPSTIVNVEARPMATSAKGGSPGQFTPASNATPPTYAALTKADPPVTADPATKWPIGQHVKLGDGSQAHWDGTKWLEGAAP